MPITIKPKKMLVSKNATEGGGGMDIATKRDALVSSLTKTAKKAMTGTGRLSDQDVARAMSMARGMISPKKAKGGARAMSTARGMISPKKAKGGKIKK